MPDLLTTFATTPWPCEIDAAVCRAGRDRADRAHYAETAPIVERGRDPNNPRRRITVAALNAWVERCKATPTEDHPHVAEHPPSRVTPAR